MTQEVPDSKPSEQAVLGALLCHPKEAYEQVKERIGPEHFFNTGHKQIYESIVALHSKKVGVDIISLTGALQEARILESSGGPAYLCELQGMGMHFYNLRHYVDILVNYHHRRQLLRATRSIECVIMEESEDIQLAANEMKLAIKGWEESAEPEKEVDRSPWLLAVEDLENKFDARQTKGSGVSLGLSTSLTSMDRLDYGIQPQTFTIIAARPSQGKTKLYGQMILSAARQEAKSLTFSMEESASQFIQAILCQDRCMSTGALDGYLRDQDLPLITRSAGYLRDYIYVDDSPALTVDQIRTRAKRFMVKHPDTKIIGVDHHMLIKPAQGRKNATDESLLAEISIGISQLKKELGVAVILLCQINREGAKSGRPRMNHIKGSGQFEADADKLWIIDMEDDNTGLMREGKLHKDKGRNSGLGSIDVTFSKTHLLFKEKEPQ